ncbi:MAG: carboxypeptidase regulatory-like domain-containing protein, partial [Elusimicrobia bacterium]|nr:carboxypeptidase regulatory-like domain-containing protein [Elusimicrobiota bacterium]
MSHHLAGRREEKGFTLVEIMVGLLIITVAFVSSILVNKTKTLATNLAQEKIETLKNLSYYRLLVTTASTTDSNFSGVAYDIGNYPEEVLNVGGTTFRRRSYVEYLKQDGDNLIGQAWTANDTGIKRISCYVVWEEDQVWKKVEIRNLRNNPNRAELEYAFQGVISSGTTGNPIPSALVETQQNPSYFARTAGDGSYSFKVQPGTYSLRASATGYFVSVTTNYVVSSGQTGTSYHNFSLTLKALGQTTGYAYIQDHLVVTQVVASTDVGGGEQEWVELFNPTTYEILIASRSSTTSNFNIFFVTVSWIDSNDAEPASGNNAKYLVGMPGITGSVFTSFRSTSVHWNSNTSTISVPSNRYFLVANQSTITFTTPSGNINRIADAYYAGNRLDNSGSGGIRVTGSMGTSVNGRTDWHDGVSWKSTAGDNSPTLSREGSSGYDLSSLNGLSSGELLYRSALKTDEGNNSQTITITRRQETPFGANCFDRNRSGVSATNGSDWLEVSARTFLLTSSGVLNSDYRMVPISGTPAEGASASANDGLSSVSYVQSHGSFTITSLATGTWSVTISSGNFTRDISSVTIAPSVSTGVPNGSTDPVWQYPTLSPAWGYVSLTTSSIYGYISGTVTDIFGQGLSAVAVETSGASTVYTDSLGKYRLSVEPSGSALSVTASKSGYSTEIVSDIGVTVGVNISTVNFTLVTAGSVKGFVTTNGFASGALPGVPVVAYDLSTTT